MQSKLKQYYHYAESSTAWHFISIIYTHAKQVNKMQWVRLASLHRHFAQV